MKHSNAHTALLFRHGRSHLGKSLRAMAKALNISAAKLSRIESGHFAPDITTVEKLLALHGGISLEDLFIQAYR